MFLQCHIEALLNSHTKINSLELYNPQLAIEHLQCGYCHMSEWQYFDLVC